MIRSDTNGALQMPSHDPFATSEEVSIDRVDLLGTLVGPDGSVGFLRYGNGTVHRVVPGDAFRGWRIAEIGEGRMTIDTGGSRRTLFLQSKSGQ